MLSRRLLSLLVPARARLAWAVGIGLLITASYVSQGVLVAQVIDRVLAGSTLLPLLTRLLGVLVLFVVRALLIQRQEVVAAKAAAVVKTALRRRLYSRLLVLGPAYGLVHRTGESLSTLVDSVEALDPYVGLYFPQVLTSAIGATAIVVIIMAISPVVGAVVAVSSLAVVSLPRLVRRALNRMHGSYWLEWRVLGADYLDSVQGITTLKALGVSEAHGMALASRSRRFYRASVGLTAISNVSVGAISFLSSAGAAISVGVGAVLAAEGHLSVFGLLLVLMLSREAFRPLQDLQSALHASFNVPPAVRAVFDLFDAVPTVCDPVAVRDQRVSAPPAVEYDEVVFSYRDDGRPALDAFSASVSPGETLALVGPSGSGKTTAVSLLLRFFEPSSGAVRIDGWDIRQMPLEALWASVAVVSQDAYLFHGTVADNIAFGRRGATPEEVEAAAVAANAHQFITALPDGYQTIIGERGLKLSGGERQRLAIARAVLKDAPLLVLDEATSAVDVAGERAIQEAIDRLSEGRTKIVIAHRLTTVERADRVVVLEHGRAVETGDPLGLAASRGAYARLLRIGEPTS